MDFCARISFTLGDDTPPNPGYRQVDPIFRKRPAQINSRGPQTRHLLMAHIRYPAAGPAQATNGRKRRQCYRAVRIIEGLGTQRVDTSMEDSTSRLDRMDPESTRYTAGARFTEKN